ncbi:methyl-accepting chemotaxis protein [Bosea sp. CS1GBMeth4]|uniref:methyl-accepting chemotaxis protein n=1 Tax=Bosea sp. CS1GBMeth4 TaxID=1892849 RepID=UPI001646CCE5|nr:methyl-accepting chemotaxis protein [Bosea sp. CS1GBMeth4]
MQLNPFARSEQSLEIAAINRSMAMISFDLKGTILHANEIFLTAFGYSLDQVKGRHHSIFVPKEEAAAPAYKAFWERLGRGEFVTGQFLRMGADGSDVWIAGSYTPVLGTDGRPVKVVKLATVITEQKNSEADLRGQVAAIGKAMAVISFSLDGRILDANENFLAAMGYSLAEIRGQHHSMFCEPAYRDSPAYRAFWEKLGRGEYDAGQYLRLGKGGREVWIQASYNPIMDAKGRPTKVVKYATDITQAQKAARQLAAAVDEAQAIIGRAKDKDLTQRIPLAGKEGGIATLCTDINGLLDNMAEVIGAVGVISAKVAGAADRIASESVKLAERTENQASSLQETAATTEELAASIKTSAGNSRQAAALGEEARTVAARGGAIVTDAVTAMERIEQASTSIADIISMIDEISFQTNLLALNAAVEAARAGDAGRGFAVVASEVRALAGRSSESANGIKALITNSSEQVRSGVKLVKDAGRTLDEIVEAAHRVAGTIAEISSAAAEQANGVEEMAKTVAHMDEMTQKNSLMADASSKLSRDLQAETQALAALVGDFRLGPGDTAGAMASSLRAVLPAMKAAVAPAQPAARAPVRVASGGGADGWAEF